jgi:hypothetical protein
MKSFDVPLKLDPKEIIAKAKVAAKESGVQMEGDEIKGFFKGHGIEGHYSIAKDILAIEITKKPMIMPWSLIETKLRNYFG